jgi:hypothetical protein
LFSLFSFLFLCCACRLGALPSTLLFHSPRGFGWDGLKLIGNSQSDTAGNRLYNARKGLWGDFPFSKRIDSFYFRSHYSPPPYPLSLHDRLRTTTANTARVRNAKCIEHGVSPVADGPNACNPAIPHAALIARQRRPNPLRPGINATSRSRRLLP